MRTSKVISLTYSSITICLVLIAGIVFYLCTSHYSDGLYFHYMAEKGEAVAEERFEKDELTPARYRNVVRRRENSIPTSAELFINTADKQKALRQLSRYMTKDEALRVLADHTVNFKRGDEVGTAFLYDDNEGKFAVVILSRNPYGRQLSHVIALGIMLMVLLSAVVLYLISKLYAMRVVDHIHRDYETEKMFVDNASHEINNPLTSIQGECEIALLRERSPEEYRSSLRKIADDTSRIINIMRQLLSFSHIRTISVDESNYDLVSMSAFMSAFADERVQVRVEADFAVRVKEDLLHIAIGNIISNALKYSDGKPVTVTVEKNTITVKDEGIGIPKEDLGHVFEPFYRAANATGKRGHGIGLALSKSILAVFHAGVEVSSKPGVGTRFTIKFSRVE